MNAKVQGLIRLSMASGKWTSAARAAANGPRQPYVFVICDLDTPEGEAVARVLNSQDFRRRTPDQNVWTFLYSLAEWQEFRKRATGSGAADCFAPEVACAANGINCLEVGEGDISNG